MGYRHFDTITKEDPTNILGLRIIGAVDGIYEFHVNSFSRRLFPGMDMR